MLWLARLQPKGMLETPYLDLQLARKGEGWGCVWGGEGVSCRVTRPLKGGPVNARQRTFHR